MNVLKLNKNTPVAANLHTQIISNGTSLCYEAIYQLSSKDIDK